MSQSLLIPLTIFLSILHISYSRSNSGRTTYDYIVIGAGTAGSIVASELALNFPNKDILLIEEGYFSVANPDIDDMTEFFDVIDDITISKGYVSVAQPGLNNRVISLPRAKVTGGCGSINANYYAFANENDFEQRWGNIEGWTLHDLLPIWEDVDLESYHDYIEDTPSAPEDPFINRLINAGLGQGYVLNEDFNDLRNNRSQIGVGESQFQCEVFAPGEFLEDEYYLKRHSSWVDFIEPILPTINNLDIEIFTRADRLIVNGNKGKVYGVETYHTAKFRNITYYAKKEVIVSAGTYDTPKLLKLSGIGDCSEGGELDMLGIMCEVDVKGVGENLQDHMAHVMLSSPVVENSELEQNIEIGWAPRGVLAVEDKGEVFHLMSATDLGTDEDPSLSTFVVLVITVIQQASSLGSVTLSGKDPSAAPIIDHNYFDREYDRNISVEAFKRTRELLYDSGALDGWILDPSFEILPGASVQTDEEILEMLRNSIDTGVHPVGTCKMGLKSDMDTDDSIVVDERLMVKGMKNLRVIDASIMPKIVSAPTNQVTMVIGLKGARMIIEDNGNGHGSGSESSSESDDD